MILILAIIYLIAGVLLAIIVFVKKPKIEFQIPKEYEQLVKDVEEWLGR